MIFIPYSKLTPFALVILQETVIAAFLAQMP
jgi:hypothetical protein